MEFEEEVTWGSMIRTKHRVDQIVSGSALLRYAIASRLRMVLEPRNQTFRWFVHCDPNVKVGARRAHLIHEIRDGAEADKPAAFRRRFEAYSTC